MTPYERVFGVRSLNGGPIRQYADETFEGMFQSKFTMHGRNLGADQGSNTVEWDEVQFPKTAAGFTSRSAPAQQETPLSSKNKVCALAHIKLKKFLPAARVFSQRSAGELRANAAQVVADEQRASLKRINSTREAMAAGVLQGSFDAASVGSEVSFQLTFGVTTRVAPANWDLPGTKLISSEIPATKDAFYEAARMEARQVILDRNTKNYIRGNSEVQTWLAPTGLNRDAIRLEADRTVGPALDGFELDGLRYMVNRAGYDNGAGSLVRFMQDDRSIWLPDDSMLSEVLGYAEGWGDIPRQAIGNGGGVIGQAPSPGVYSYATSNEEPVGINLYTGWVGLFVLTQPSAVLLLTSKV